MSWTDRLQPASYRGVPFGVFTDEGRVGRRNALHEYPYRDTVWVEDLGRAARRFSLVGFLVENSLIYGGGDVLAQRDLMIAAAERSGDGELVHPTLGTMTVSLMDFGWRARWDSGRVIEIGFSFIEAGQRVFPSVLASTGDEVGSAADAADVAASADFATRAEISLAQGAATVKQAVTTAQVWARKAQGLANDATNLYNMVGSLPGTFGRYFGGRRRGGFGNLTQAVGAQAGSVSGLVSIGTRARADVGNAASAFTGAAGGLGL